MALVVCSCQQSLAQSPYQKVEEVFNGNKTVVGETIDFPRDGDSVRALVVTMGPGEKTGWHRHGAPLFAYILDGELTVTYQGIGNRVYRSGDALLEAMSVLHRGHNTGTKDVQILAVFLSGDDKPLTTPVK